MDSIYTLVTVAILLSKKIWEEENSLYCSFWYVFTCNIDRTYNSILKIPGVTGFLIQDFIVHKTDFTQ